MDRLPTELIMEILRLLESPEIVSLVCKRFLRAHQRMMKIKLHVRKVPKELLSSGNVEAFSVLWNPYKELYSSFIPFCNVEFLEQWMKKLNRKICLTDTTLTEATYVGNLNLMKWLREQG